MSSVAHYAADLRPVDGRSRCETFPSVETMVGPRVDDAAGSSPAPLASARSGRLEAGSSFAQPSRRHSILTVSAAAALIACAAAAAASAQPVTAPAPASPVARGVTIADFITEASQRFGVPESWIAAVMRIESAFDPRATSPKGAMGLMQLMPDTWAAMRVQLGLGGDPYDPRDNILAGAGYLRALYDQFGAGGFLAAYNAGPKRYLDFLNRGRPLPPETRRYVAAVVPVIDQRAGAGGPALLSGLGRQVPRGPTLFAPVVVSVDAAAPKPPHEGAPLAPLEPAPRATDGLFADAGRGTPP